MGPGGAAAITDAKKDTAIQENLDTQSKPPAAAGASKCVTVSGMSRFTQTNDDNFSFSSGISYVDAATAVNDAT